MTLTPGDTVSPARATSGNSLGTIAGDGDPALPPNGYKSKTVKNYTQALMSTKFCHQQLVDKMMAISLCKQVNGSQLDTLSKIYHILCFIGRNNM